MEIPLRNKTYYLKIFLPEPISVLKIDFGSKLYISASYIFIIIGKYKIKIY